MSTPALTIVKRSAEQQVINNLKNHDGKQVNEICAIVGLTIEEGCAALSRLITQGIVQVEIIKAGDFQAPLYRYVSPAYRTRLTAA